MQSEKPLSFCLSIRMLQCWQFIHIYNLFEDVALKCALRTVHRALCIVHRALCIVHCALCIVLLCALCSALCNCMVPCPVHCVFCIFLGDSKLFELHWDVDCLLFSTCTTAESLPDFLSCILRMSFTVFYYLHYVQLVLGATLHLFQLECFPLRIIFCSAAEPLLVMHRTLLQFITPPISIATGQNIWDAFQSAVVCKRRPLHPVGWSRSTSRFIMLKPLGWKNQASIDKS